MPNICACVPLTFNLCSGLQMFPDSAKLYCSLTSLVAVVCLVGGGCASISESLPSIQEKDSSVESSRKKEPKKLLEWAVGAKEVDKEKKDNGKEAGNQNGPGNEAKAGGNNNSSEAKDNEEKRLDPDRPHLPESSTTVGLGRVMLESGYTFNEKGSSFRSQTYPEALLRIGMLAEWFELRIGQSFIDQHSNAIKTPGQPGLGPNPGPTSSALNEHGAQDLYLGVKFALTEQQKCLPESALIFQATVPTGTRSVSANQVLPGVNYDASWEIVKDLASVEIVLSANGLKDDSHHTFVNLVSGLTGLYNVTHNLEAFAEWDAFYPAGAIGESAAPQHYVVGGFVYYLNNNFEVDIRAGVGLNDHANDFLTGAGFSVRY
jgi:hypothetical protein